MVEQNQNTKSLVECYHKGKHTFPKNPEECYHVKTGYGEPGEISCEKDMSGCCGSFCGFVEKDGKEFVICD